MTIILDFKHVCLNSKTTHMYIMITYDLRWKYWLP